MTQDPKKIIERLLIEGVCREGMWKLLWWMDQSDFYEAPASSGGGKHLAIKGGLALHSISVLRTAMYLMWQGFVDDLDSETMIVTCLLHDLGKAGDYGKPLYTENILKSGKQSDAKPWERNKNLTNIPHALKSVIITERFVRLSEEEEYAILYHDGLYDRETGGAAVVPGHESKLLLLLHFADLWSSRFIETREDFPDLIKGYISDFTEWLDQLQNEELPFH